LVEILIVVIVIGLLAAIVGPATGKWMRRSEDMAALSSGRQVLALARLEAIKTTSNVIVVINANPDNTIHLLSFRDRASRCASGVNVGNPCTQDSECPGSTCRLGLARCASGVNFGNPCAQDGECPGSTCNLGFPDDGNGTQDAGEPTLANITLPVRIHFWKQGDIGTKDSVAGAALFDACLGLPDPSGRCLVFLPSGGITRPASGLPTGTGGRGLYFADWQGKNYFRLTVESDLSGKGRVDKYIEGSGYFPPSPANRWSWL
jgi:type II secretory pathway pseudopilin PulG